MKHSKITAMLLALCTLLSVTACADRGSSAAEPAPVESLDTTETASAAPDSSIPDSEADSRADSAADSAVDSRADSSADSAAETTTALTSEQSRAPEETVTLPASEKPALVKKLQSVSIPAGVSSVVPAGGGKAVVTGNDGICYFVDIAQDKLVSTVKRKSAYEQALGVNANGTELITLYSDFQAGDDPVLRRYDIASGRCTELVYQGGSFGFSYDRSTDTVYGRDSFTVSRLGWDGTETVLYEVSDKMQGGIAEVYAQQGLFTESSSGGDAGGYSEVFRRLSDGKELFRVPNRGSTFLLGKEGLLLMVMAQLNSEDTQHTDCMVYDLKTGEKRRAFGVCTGSYPMQYADADSRYMVVCTMNEEKYTPKAVLLFDLQTGRQEKLPFDLKKANEVRAGYIPALGCWVAALITEQGSGKYTTALYRIDPTQAAFAQAALPVSEVNAEKSTVLGSDMKEARAKADAIEKKYGISILIGNEVYKVDISGFRLISTEVHDGKYLSPDVDGAMITRLLDDLDGHLARYPEKFFDRFRADGFEGLRISLAGALLDWDVSKAGPGGVAFQSGNRFEIVLDYSEADAISTSVHHELFHSVEQLMSTQGVVFDSDEWNALNPPGFEYGAYYEHTADKYPVIGGGGDDRKAYFTRDYGTANAMEDRACIAQRCFGRGYQGVSCYDQIQDDYPFIKAKLDYMEQKLTECFGSSYLSEIKS